MLCDHRAWIRVCGWGCRHRCRRRSRRRHRGGGGGGGGGRLLPRKC